MRLQAPKHLTPDVAKVWLEQVAALDEEAPPRLGPEFDAYCTCIARMRDAQQRIAAEELIVPDSKNAPVAHPAFAIERQCADDLRKWGRKFAPSLY